MRSLRSPIGACCGIFRSLAVVGIVAGIAGSARADDPSITYSFKVPNAPPKKGAGGWGKLILTFDKPITGGTFVFQPECGPGVGPAGVLSPNSMSIALGPGNYGLGVTGTPDENVDPVQNYGTMDITINYAADPPPVLNLTSTSSFWEYKGTATDPTNMFYVMGSGQDLGLVPEPSTIALGLGGLVAFVSRRRRPA